jgi:hypothetical protein
MSTVSVASYKDVHHAIAFGDIRVAPIFVASCGLVMRTPELEYLIPDAPPEKVTCLYCIADLATAIAYNRGE